MIDGAVHRILVVDDEPRIAEMIQTILECEGFSVETACCGRDCLKNLREKDIDLVLLDIKLEDVDGWTLLEELRNDHEISSVPVIILTAKEEGEKKDIWMKERGVEDYITKPFEPEELVTSIRRVLGLGRPILLKHP